MRALFFSVFESQQEKLIMHIFFNKLIFRNSLHTQLLTAILNFLQSKSVDSNIRTITHIYCIFF